MPIYEYKCEVHGRFEKVISYKDRNDFELCQANVDNGKCSIISQLVISAPSMQPDTFWSENYVEAMDKTYSRKSSFNQDMKEKNLTMDRPKHLSNSERASLASSQFDKVRKSVIADVVQQFN